MWIPARTTASLHRWIFRCHVTSRHDVGVLQQEPARPRRRWGLLVYLSAEGAAAANRDGAIGFGAAQEEQHEGCSFCCPGRDACGYIFVLVSLAGGMMAFMRRYSTAWPYSSSACPIAPANMLAGVCTPRTL